MDLSQDEHPQREVLRPNQVVAYNLVRARRLRGLTQQEAAERLAPYLGVRWSNVVFSAAERSIAGARVREFTADEIFAFAQAFDLSIAWFFLPPGGDADSGDGALPMVCAIAGGPKQDRDDGAVKTPGEVLNLIWNQEIGATIREVNDRIDSYEQCVDAAFARSASVDHLSRWARALIADALVRETSLAGLDAVIRRLAVQMAAFEDDLQSRRNDDQENKP